MVARDISGRREEVCVISAVIITISARASGVINRSNVCLSISFPGGSAYGEGARSSGENCLLSISCCDLVSVSTFRRPMRSS